MQKYNIEKIGEIDHGIDGYDEIFLVEDSMLHDINIRDLEEEMFNRFAFDSRNPGSLFCNRIYANYVDTYSKDRCYLTLKIQRDI